MLRLWGWCFGLDIGGQRGRPRLTADGYPEWMPAVYAHAVALAGKGKDALQGRMRERLHAEAVTLFSYDTVLRSLV